MSYQQTKSKNFARYCREGKMHLVKKWGTDPNVDVNWNMHSPLRYSVKDNAIESIKYLLNHSKLKTDYENDRKPLFGTSNIGGKPIEGELNPFTEAMRRKNFEILDLFVNSGKFTIKRKVNLDILYKMEDEELNDYFRKIDGFTDYVIEMGGDYLNILPPEAKDIFLF